MMTRERAQFILSNQLLGGDLKYAFRAPWMYSKSKIHADGITEAEDAYVKAVWDKIPSGSSCYMDAINKIARGEDKMIEVYHRGPAGLSS